MNHYLKILLLTIAGLYATPKAYAQFLSLDSIYARIERNPSLSAFEADIKAKNAYANGAGSLDAPRLSAGQYQTPYQLRPSMGSFMISAEQQFTNPAKLRAKAAYMESLSTVTMNERSDLKNQLFSQAKDAYSKRVILEKKITVLRETKALLRYILKEARLKLAYGKEQLSSIYSLSADTYILENTFEELRNEIEQQNILLNTLMSSAPGSVFKVDTLLEDHAYEKAVTDSTLLITARSDIRQQTSSLLLKKLAVNIEQRKRLPDFGIQLAHMFSYGGVRNQYILMGSMTFPFMPWASREYKANLKGLSFELEELKDQRRNLYNQAIGKIAALRLELDSKKRQLVTYGQHIIPELINSYQTALLAYKQNTGDLSAVLAALKAVQNARLESLTLQQEIIQSEIVYERENERY